MSCVKTCDNIGDVDHRAFALHYPFTGENGQAVIGVATFSAGQGAKAKGIGYSLEKAPSLKAASSGTNMVPALCIGNGQLNQIYMSEQAGTLTCAHDQQAVLCAALVRQLTPLECERLQGYPDGWTDISEFTDQYGIVHPMKGWTDSNGKWHKEADSPRYKSVNKFCPNCGAKMEETT